MFVSLAWPGRGSVLAESGQCVGRVGVVTGVYRPVLWGNRVLAACGLVRERGNDVRSSASAVGVLVALAGGAVVGGVLTPECQADTVVVYAFDFDFSIYRPEEGLIVDAEIFVGDTIRWEFLHELHNVVAVAGQAEDFASDIFGPGDSFVWTFTHEGVFNYYCQPHGFDNFDGTATGMAGKVTVHAVPGPGAAALLLFGGLAMGRRRRS